MVETMRETRRIWLFSKQTTNEQLLEEHIRISDAIKEQNAELVQERMREHLGNVEKVLAKYIQ
jgi:GntR family transcriptional repressor for pyruvate dehydrogenase complex